MKFKTHPILSDLEVREDGKVIKYKGSKLKIIIYRRPPNNTPQERVNFLGKTHTVAKLVCETYHGMRKDASYCVKRKKPGSLHYLDLYWDKQGRSFNPKKDKRSATSKIAPNEIKVIEKRLQKGETLKSIAKDYNTSDMSIHRIRKKMNERNAQKKKNQ